VSAAAGPGTAVDRRRSEPAVHPGVRPRRGPPALAKPSASTRAAQIVTTVVLWTYAAIALGPLILMALNSLRPTSEIFAEPLGLPAPPTFEGYGRAWEQASFDVYFTNSALVTTGAVLLCTAVSVLAAYPLGRYVFRGSRALSIYFLSGLMLPFRLAILPIFYLLAAIGLVDSRLGLMLVYAASGVPFSVFVLTAFFRQLPRELEEAARIDGAGELTIFARVMLPLVRPALATVAVFQFVPLWNDFFFPLVLLRSSEKATLPVGLTVFFGQFQTDWSTLFAGLMITTIPLVILFVAATKQVIAGLVAGIGR
jgi:raffinose/stachyose/melibiose transport system permease protein